MDTGALLDEFRAEARDHLLVLEGQLLRLERRDPDHDSLHVMFRSAHTIKGGAALIGLAQVRTLAHATEDALAYLRDGGRLDRGMIDLLFRVVDELQALCARALPGIAAREPAADDLLREVFRSEDVVGRWGGEEFVVGMFGMSAADGAGRLTDMLDIMIGEMQVDAHGDTAGSGRVRVQIRNDGSLHLIRVRTNSAAWRAVPTRTKMPSSATPASWAP